MDAFHLVILFAVLLNPFSQILYFAELMSSMKLREFSAVYFRASLLSLGIYILFAWTGDFAFREVFQIRADAFQIFGGLIMLVLAYRYITEGSGSNVLFKGRPEDLALKMSLPFMVGPGTIWVSILIGRNLPMLHSAGVLTGVLAANFAGMVLAQSVYTNLERHRETMVGKYVAILMRTNALFIGAIGTEMILAGLESSLVK